MTHPRVPVLNSSMVGVGEIKITSSLEKLVKLSAEVRHIINLTFSNLKFTL